MSVLFMAEITAGPKQRGSRKRLAPGMDLLLNTMGRALLEEDVQQLIMIHYVNSIKQSSNAMLSRKHRALMSFEETAESIDCRGTASRILLVTMVSKEWLSIAHFSMLKIILEDWKKSDEQVAALMLCSAIHRIHLRFDCPWNLPVNAAKVWVCGEMARLRLNYYYLYAYPV